MFVEGIASQNNSAAKLKPSTETICQLAQIIRICRPLKGDDAWVGTIPPDRK